MIFSDSQFFAGCFILILNKKYKIRSRDWIWKWIKLLIMILLRSICKIKESFIKNISNSDKPYEILLIVSLIFLKMD